MATAEQKRKRAAPYVSAKVLSEFFDHIRYVREPDNVDSGLLQDYGVSVGNSFALLSTLKFLGLTDDRGKPTPAFRQLQVGGDEFRDALKGILGMAYSDLFSRLDVSRDTRDKIVNFFARNYSPATAERAARLFLDLCGEAGIPTASQPRQRQTPLAKGGSGSSRPNNASRRPPQQQLDLPEEEPERVSDLEPAPERVRPRPQNLGLKTVNLPLTGTDWVTLEGPFPMDEKTWQQMLDMLNALKPGLTE